MAEVKSKVTVKNLAQSPLKLRLVADLVRGKKADNALDILKFLNKKGASYVYKAIKSAIASASDRFGMNAGDLVVSKISVDEAPTFKRGRFASRGRFSRIVKRRSHLNLELSAK